MRIQQSFKSLTFVEWYLRLMLSKLEYKDYAYIPYCITITYDEKENNQYNIWIYFTTDTENFKFLDAQEIWKDVQKLKLESPNKFQYSFFSKKSC